MDTKRRRRRRWRSGLGRWVYSRKWRAGVVWTFTLFSFFLFFFKILVICQILYRPKFTSQPKLAGIVRNDRNGLKRPEIWPEVERGVFWYRFTYRYKKFRPFRPEQNGINNNGKKYHQTFYLYYRLISLAFINNTMASFSQKKKKKNFSCLSILHIIILT